MAKLIIAVVAAAVAHLAYLTASGKCIRRMPANLSEREARSVYELQFSIFWRASGCSIGLLLVWVPLVFMLAPGAACRPMGQELLSFILVPLGTIFGLLRTVRQFFATSETRVAAVAAVVSLTPLMVYLLMKWAVVGLHHIVYEE